MECRDDSFAREIAAVLDDPNTRAAVSAERPVWRRSRRVAWRPSVPTPSSESGSGATRIDIAGGYWKKRTLRPCPGDLGAGHAGAAPTPKTWVPAWPTPYCPRCLAGTTEERIGERHECTPRPRQPAVQGGLRRCRARRPAAVDAGCLQALRTADLVLVDDRRLLSVLAEPILGLPENLPVRVLSGVDAQDRAAECLHALDGPQPGRAVVLGRSVPRRQGSGRGRRVRGAGCEHPRDPRHLPADGRPRVRGRRPEPHLPRAGARRRSGPQQRIRGGQPGRQRPRWRRSTTWSPAPCTPAAPLIRSSSPPSTAPRPGSRPCAPRWAG